MTAIIKNSTAQETASCFRVQLEQNLGIKDVRKIREILLEAITSGIVEIDTRQLTGADVAIVQLLIAARKSAEQQGQTLKLVTLPDGPLQALLTGIGLDPTAEGFSSEQS